MLCAFEARNQESRKMDYPAKPTEPPSRSDPEKIAESFFLTVLFVMAFIANSTVCFVLLQPARRLRNPSNVLLFSVILASLLVTLLCLPFSLAAVLTDGWPFGDAWCQISGFLLNTFTCASNFAITAVAISRYYLIVKPLSVKVNLKRARTMVGFVWFCAFIVALPPLFGWGAYKYSSATGTCSVHWKFGGSALAYSVYLVTVSFLLPFGILVYAYQAIYKKAKRQSKKTAYNTLRGLGNGFLPPIKESHTVREKLGCLGRSSSQSTTPSYNERDNHSSPATSANSFSAGEEIGTETLPKMDANVKKEIISRTLSRQNSVFEQRTVQNAFLLAFALVLCVCPYYFVGLWSGVSQKTPPNALNFTVSFLLFAMAAINPIIYGYFNRPIKRLLRRFPLYRKIWKSGQRKSYRHSSEDSGSATGARRNNALEPD